jgi:hypothetical protein
MFALCLYGFPAWGVGWPLDVLYDPFHAHDTLLSSIFVLLSCTVLSYRAGLGSGTEESIKRLVLEISFPQHHPLFLS